MPDTQADILNYYSQPGLMTDPGSQAHLFDGFPTDIGSLCKVVQNNLLHIFWAERYGVALAEERKQEVNLRPVNEKLTRLLEIDSRSLLEPRPPEQRLVGNCRDFTVMLVSILRHQGVPARARCGFGAYFLPNHYEDHWVCEYWNTEQQRWVLVDSQLDDLQRDVLQISFDPLDVPRDQFIVGGKAWQMCRSGQADPDCFGIFDMHGLWFVAGDLIRDFLSFNKVEILPWDGGWGYLTQEAVTSSSNGFEGDLFDRVAALTLEGDSAFSRIRSLYETDSRWYLPESIISNS